MSTLAKLPTSLIEAIRYFSDLDVCTEYVAKLRWPNGPVCPRCACTEYSYLTTRRVWKCKACKRQYSVKVGTVFEESRLGLDKWLPAVWLAANSKNGISSHELARSLGITQKSAWFMLHRIRLAMKTGSLLALGGRGRSRRDIHRRQVHKHARKGPQAQRRRAGRCGQGGGPRDAPARRPRRRAKSSRTGARAHSSRRYTTRSGEARLSTRTPGRATTVSARTSSTWSSTTPRGT